MSQASHGGKLLVDGVGGQMPRFQVYAIPHDDDAVEGQLKLGASRRVYEYAIDQFIAFGVVPSFCSCSTSPTSSSRQYQMERSPRSKPIVNFG